MSWERIQEGSNKTIVEYDEDRDMYRVSFFDDDWHFLKDAMFDTYNPRKHGEWREEFRSQKSPDGYFYWNTPQKKIYVCSICGREEVKKEPYCNCGAKMDGDDE